MRTKPLTAALGVVLTALTSLSVSACSVSVHRDADPVVRAENLGPMVSDALAKVGGRHPDNVACLQDLPAIVGSTTRCVLTDGGTRLGVTVSAASVHDGDRVGIDVQVDQRPM
jgi:hypothetical protein